MQLFITNFKIDWKIISIQNKDIAHQMKKVLRMKAWDLFFVQNTNLDKTNEINRYQVSITQLESSSIIWEITKTEHYTKQNQNTETNIAIAMPNKRSKAELITQKLSELWINKIYFRPSQRSVIKQSNEKKISRLMKIAQEATEQSRWWTLPTIEFIKDISKISQNTDTKTIVFDKSNQDIIIKPSTEKNKHNKLLWIIWPEGWLTSKDYQNFWKKYTTQSIWDTILRTETASIIAGRILKSID